MSTLPFVPEGTAFITDTEGIVSFYPVRILINEGRFWDGEKVTERVPVGCAHYERIYDSLIAAIERGEPKCVRDDEVVTVLEILEEATRVAQSHKA